MLNKVIERFFLLRRKSFCLCHKEMKSLKKKIKEYLNKNSNKTRGVSQSLIPPLQAQQLVVKIKIYADSTGERKEKINNNPNPDPASAWKSCCLHGNPATRMEIPPWSSRSCESPSRASLQPVPDEFLLISGQQHPEMQLITPEGGPGMSRVFTGCELGHDGRTQKEHPLYSSSLQQLPVQEHSFRTLAWSWPAQLLNPPGIGNVPLEHEVMVIPGQALHPIIQ